MLNLCYAEPNRHTVADAFYNGELESEIRLLVTTRGTVTLSDFTFRKDSDREALMEKTESIHSQTVYHHHECTPDCKKGTNFGSKRSSTIVVVKIPRCVESENIIIYMYFFTVGCGTLWVKDSIWKLTIPHCMHRVKVPCLKHDGIVTCLN